MKDDDEVTETNTAPEETTASARSEEAGAPDFRSLKDPQEIVDCYNEMVIVAEDLGLKNFLVKDGFNTVETGWTACEEIHAAITAAKTQQQESKPVKATKRSARSPSKEKKETTMARTATAEKTPRGSKAAAKAPAKAAPKAGKKNAEGGEVRSLKYGADMKIQWLNNEITSREGSNRYERAKLAKQFSGKKVAAYLQAGGTGRDLSKLEEIGLIKVS